MREYFRWATNLELGAIADRHAVGTWITTQEQRWEALLEPGHNELTALPLASGLGAFEEERVNALIDADRLVYGAGIGRFGVPMFFLAMRESQSLRDGVEVVVAGRELARGFVAAPAVSRRSRIVVRVDALRRWLWTRAETARTRLPDDPFRLALTAYGADDPMEVAIDRMARGEIESLILHELGELRAGHIVGPDWERMLAQLDHRRSEIVARAVRDLMADCLVTLPTLIERRAAASLDFWVSNFDGLRRALAPELLDASVNQPGSGNEARMRRTIAAEQARWSEVAMDLLAYWRRDGPEGVVKMTGALHPD